MQSKRVQTMRWKKKVEKTEDCRRNWVNSFVNISLGSFFFIEKINYGKLIVEKHDLLSADANADESVFLLFFPYAVVLIKMKETSVQSEFSSTKNFTSFELL